MTATATEPVYLRCTKREIDVLRVLTRDGAGNDVIGQRLRPPVGVETVKTHLSRIMQRTQIPNRAALAVALLRRDLVVLDNAGHIVPF